MSIEDVYQDIIKKSSKGQAPSKDSKLYKPYNTKIATPFTRQLALLGRQPVISKDYGYISEVDKKRDDVNRIVKQSPSFIIFKNLKELSKFPDVNIDKLDVSEDTKSKIYDAQRVIKNAKSYDPLNLIRISDNEAKELAKDYYNIQKLHTDIMRIIVKEVWGLTMKTSPSTFSAKDLTPVGDSELLQTKEDKEDFSYYVAYLPLWQEWARQNPELIEELREKAKGKVLTDMFANTRVSQARALADILNESTSATESSGLRGSFVPKTVSLSTVGYKKGDPQEHPDVDYVFTENAEAYIASHSFPLEEEPDIVFPNQGKTKLNVSDVNGTNQAGIRTDSKGNISPNAYGIVVKKYQQDVNGKFVAKEGQFQDTDDDFNLFVKLNEDMFRRLSESKNTKVVFPTQMGLGKAALPKRFVEWLQSELSTRFGINSTIEKNQRADYDGYGLKLNSISNTTLSSNTSNTINELAELGKKRQNECK